MMSGAVLPPRPNGIGKISANQCVVKMKISPSTLPKDIEIFKAMGPVKRLQLAGKMYHDAKILKRAALKSLNPTWSEQQIEAKLREIFLHGTP